MSTQSTADLVNLGSHCHDDLLVTQQYVGTSKGKGMLHVRVLAKAKVCFTYGYI
jgi:hypothetical protein